MARGASAPLARQWLGEQNFKAEKHRVLLLPDAAGGIAAAVGGLGKRQGELSLWHAAGFAERLPRAPLSTGAGLERRRRPRSCASDSPTAAYRFDRYRAGQDERAATPRGAAERGSWLTSRSRPRR